MTTTDTVRSGRFVGREPELARLHELRRASAAGHGAVVLIGGEAGIGKSRLLAEFAGGLSGGRAPAFIQEECLERAPRPFGPFRGIIAKLYAASVQLAASLPPLALQAVHRFVPAAVPTGSVVRRLDKADLLAGVHALLCAVSEKRATVVAIEDLHWADAATLELLEYLAPRVSGKRIMILATVRDEAPLDGTSLTSTLGRLERERTVHGLHVPRMPGTTLRKLLRNEFDGQHEPGPEVYAEIEERSEGNPLFAEELLKHWLERREHGQLPRSIRTLITERVTRLHDEDRRVLVSAAVLGHRFDPAILASVLERDVENLARALRRARDLNLLVEESPKTFRFRHAITRQALYESQLSLTLRPLHARIARSIEALPDAAERLDELAYHWWEAQKAEEARSYNERAAEAALAAFAFADAVTYLERSLSLCADPLERARLMSELGAAQRSNGNPNAALKWCLAAKELYIAAGEPGQAIGPLMFVVAELANDDRLDEALVILGEFAAAHGQRLEATDAALFRGEQLLLEVARIDRDPAEALSRFDLPVETLTGEARLRYWTARGIAHAANGEVTSWRHDVAQLEAALDDSISPRLLLRSSAHHFIALGALYLGQSAESRRAIRESRQFMATHGLHPQGAYTEALAALDGYLTGNLAEARDAAASAAHHARFASARAVLGWAGPLIGLALDDESLIESTLYERAAENVVARGIRTPSDLAAGAAAAVLVARNNIVDARRILEAAVDTFGVFVQGELIWPLAARHVDTAHLRILVEYVDRLRNRVEHSTAHAVGALVQSIAAQRAGDKVQRRRYGEEAMQRFRDLGWPLFEAQALEAMGRVDEACDLYQRCGSIADVRRLAMNTPASGSRPLLPDTGALSQRQREVALLVAAGHTNRAVAQRLGIGEKTVETHITSVYAKLGFRSRAQLAAYIGADKARAR